MNCYLEIMPYIISLVMVWVAWPLCKALYKESANAKRRVERQIKNKIMQEQIKAENYYPGISYQKLFDAINEVGPNPTTSQMTDIIRIVKIDFIEKDEVKTSGKQNKEPKPIDTTSSQTIAKPIVSGSLLGLDEVRQPFQDALYATGRFSTEQCEQLTDGLLQYIDDAGLAVVRQ